ncbi:MAG: DUF1080 domain-containing protein [Phycisphaerales bacterium]|jgi:hypothetical protein|nr:DUF1080 domain-containing protein [Phycisphaerales bacterium]
MKMTLNITLLITMTIVLGCGSMGLCEAPKPAGDHAAVICAVKPVATVAPVPLDTKSTDATDLPLVGDWSGAIGTDPLVAQVIDMGKGEYSVNMLSKFDTRDPKLAVLTGPADKLVSGTITSGKYKGSTWTATLTEKVFIGTVTGSVKASFTLKRVMRLSHRLGAKAPAGATVLLSKKTKDINETFTKGGGKPCGWKLLPGGVIQCAPRAGSIITKKKFGSMHLHAEFRTASMPDKRGQGRSNSGFYIQNRYECQVLDSYGCEGVKNECGGLYRAVAPRVNMCAPPRQWQSYDIFFQAPKFDASGEKQIEGAHITVVHNGVLIHNDVVMAKGTGNGGRRKPIAAEYLLLQDHGNPVEFRNIWVADLKKPKTDKDQK